MPSLYILEGKKPVLIESTLDWAVWYEESDEKRIVARDEIEEVSVSTVFLGVDYNNSGEGPTILFETAIFKGKHDHFCRRYSTWEEAEEGHRKAVKMVVEEH